MRTEQNSKTGGGEYNYSSRVTELWRLTIGSQQSWLALGEM